MKRTAQYTFENESIENFRVQQNKMKNGYKTMHPDAVAELRERVLSCLNSKDIRDHIRPYFEEIDALGIIDIVLGSLKPIEYKARFMAELAEKFPHPFDELDPDSDFEVYVKLYQDAVADMHTGDGEQAVYLLIRHEYDEKFDAVPFFTFEDALDYIETDGMEAAAPVEMNESCIWYTIEKWGGMNALARKSQYTVSMQGEVWDYCCMENLSCKHPFGYGNAISLLLPVPFSVGDVITLDCRPFEPLKYGVIVSNPPYGPSTRCLYLKEDGTVICGTLQRSNVFRHRPLMSVMYNAERFQGEFPADEALLAELGVELSNLYRKDQEKYEHEWQSWFKGNEGAAPTPQELIDKVKSLNNA